MRVPIEKGRKEPSWLLLVPGIESCACSREYLQNYERVVIEEDQNNIYDTGHK